MPRSGCSTLHGDSPKFKKKVLQDNFFKVLKNCDVTLYIAINHVIKSTILICRIYLFNYIAQINYCIIETKFLTVLSKNGCKLIKVINEISLGLRIHASNTTDSKKT